MLAVDRATLVCTDLIFAPNFELQEIYLLSLDLIIRDIC